MAAADPSQSAASDAARPRFAGFSHVSMPVRDLDEACRFWTEVLGAEPVLYLPARGFAEVRIGGIILGFSQQPGGWTGRTAEFPHYAFFVEPDQMVAIKARLEAAGVPTHPIWTRNQVEALMYFRDPSGNLFELYCPRGFPGVERLPRGGAHGDYVPDLGALNYRWRG